MAQRLFLFIAALYLVGCTPIKQAVDAHPPIAVGSVQPHLVGHGVVRIHFDAAGRVDSAVFVKSTGNKILDQNTIEFAKKNWRGPPSSTSDVPIAYRVTKA